MGKTKLVLSRIVDVKSYVNEDCVHCGRHRVELLTLSSGNKYHVCEKCHWIREQERYCENNDFSYDDYKEKDTYLKEVLEDE